MPGTTNDDGLETEDGEEEEGTETEGTEEGSEGSGTDSEAPAKDEKAEKRLRDLQSKADAETARANKAEKALATLGKGKQSGNDDPEKQMLLQELREASLDAVYGEYPDLKKYGIERSLIDGATRTEMRESATSIVALVKSVASKARNEVLSEHGIKAEPAGSTRKPPVDFTTMKDEDFLKLLESM